MTISVLNKPADFSLGGLHQAADTVDEELLPCRVNNPELFFAASPTDADHAKTLCTDCPVQSLCLARAIDRPEPVGVWGGRLFLPVGLIHRHRAPARSPTTAPR